MKALIGGVTVLLLVTGYAIMDTDTHPVLVSSVVDSVQWMGGFIVAPTEVSAQVRH